jgi:DNA repair exonuclease SbcCD ATPase subunit
MARPVGSTAAIHRTRRDYRFGQETIDHIAGGMAIFAGTLKETAFVERAIAHYAEFLAGDPEALAPLTQEVEWLQDHLRRLRNAQQTSQNVAQNAAEKATDQAREIERLRVQLQVTEQERDQVQERNRELESRWNQERARKLLLETELRQARAAASKKTEQEHKRDLSKAYQIKIRHEAHQACPDLPAGLTYDESELTSSIREKNWSAHRSTVHTVLNQHWPIARVRREVERLKAVPGLLRIWIEKNGEPVKMGGVSYATDSWVKQEGRWVKE